MLFKKPALSWKDLFWFTLDYLSDSDEKFLKNTSTDAFTICLEAAYSHWKNGKMRADFGNIFKRPSPDKRSPGVEFILDETLIWSFYSLYAYFKNPCCSPWPRLAKKAAKTSSRSTTDPKTKILWSEFAEHIKERCIKCQQRLGKIENPGE
jgi:hypothetical protein